MRRMMGFGMCGLAMAFAASVTAQPPAGGTAAAKAESQRIICRTEARENGSRLGGTRACHTAAEWAELRRQSREIVDRIQTRQSMNADPTGQ